MKEFKGYTKGVDLGGWISQCAEYTTEHYQSFIKKEDFKVIASWGCDHVRLPVDYQVVQNPDGSFIPEGFTYIQNAIDWAEENNLNLILDLHKTLGYAFDESVGKNCFFSDISLHQHFYNLWEEFANRFAKYHQRVAFELLNEVTSPSYSDTWNKIIANTISIIRKISKDVKILVGGYWNNSIDALKDLDKPADENIVYNFHCYDPLLFTHQSAYWVKGMPHDFKLEYPSTFKKHNDAAKELNLTDFVVYCDDENNKFDKDYFIKKFSNGIKVCQERNVPLYCGEYGVIDNANAEDALKWYKDINAAFVELGIGRACWSYKSMSFGLIDEHMKDVLPELIKYL